jgi:hypothetical protein
VSSSHGLNIAIQHHAGPVWRRGRQRLQRSALASSRPIGLCRAGLLSFRRTSSRTAFLRQALVDGLERLAPLVYLSHAAAARVKQLSCRKPSPTDGFSRANKSVTEVHVRLPFRKVHGKASQPEFRLCITLLMESACRSSLDTSTRCRSTLSFRPRGGWRRTHLCPRP